MLKKKIRLPIHNFPEKSDVFFRGKIIVVKAVNNNLNYNRIGVVVSSGAVSSAVSRNLIKRLIFNFFKEKASLLGGRNKDILFIFRKTSKKLDKKKLILELELSINKLNK